MAGNGGQARGTVGMLVGLVPREFGRRNGRGVDADESIAGLKDGQRGVFIDEVFGASAGVQANGFHDGSPESDSSIADALEAAGMRG